MKYFILIFSLFLMSCVSYKKEFSELLYEKAIVYELIATPISHETGIDFKLVDLGGGFSIGTNGLNIDLGSGLTISDNGLGVGIGNGMQISDHKVPAKFSVIFKCQHGKFIVNGKEIYEKLKNCLNDTVTVEYKEKYKVKYNHDVIAERTLIDYDFIDAN